MGYTYYNPLKVWLDPASIADVVSYMQKYLSENPIKDTEEINQIIAEYIAAHPEIIGGVQSVNGETGVVVLTASDINTTGQTTIQAVLTSLTSQISDITQTVTGLDTRVTANATGITNEATARANADTALGNRITALQGAVGSPLLAATAAAMTDTSKIYVYTGSETGYTSGNWYYYNGTAWTSGGVYNATAINTDTTLTVAGMAADAKATGDGLNDLKSAISNVDTYLLTSSTRLYPRWEVGAINNSGVDEENSSFVRCDAILLNVGDKFRSLNASLRVFYYSLDGTFLSTLYSVTANTDYVMEQPVLVRFRAAYGSQLEVDYYDQYLTLTKTDKAVDLEQAISTFSDFDNAIMPNVLTVELSFVNGGINVSNGVDSTQANRARTGLFYVPTEMYIRSTNDGYTFRVIEYDSYRNFKQTLNNSNVSSQIVSKGYYKVLVFPVDTSITDTTAYLSEINASIWCREQKHLYIVSKDASGDFDDVQTALDFVIHASAAYPVTIFIEPGTYDPISTITQKKYVSSIPNTGIKYYNRYISLIGRNEKTCIIKGTSGEYYYPAAEINVTGLIANLTFISTHESPPENMTDDANYESHKAYAVHSDYGTEDSIYQNCTMISYQAPGIGIGGAQNKKIRIRNCHIYSYAPSSGDYSPLVNYGGLFYHLQPADGITGQLLEIEDSYIFSENGDKAMWVSASSATNYGQETHLIRNCCYGDVCGKTVSVDSALISADSYGNNVTVMNT